MADLVEARIRADERARTLRLAAQKLWVAAAVMDPALNDRVLAVTDRELETLHEVAAGKSNAAIARELHLSEDTVKTRLQSVYRKLGVADRAHAVATAYEYGLILPTYVVMQSYPAVHREVA